MITPEQLEKRKTHIGSSESPAIMGIDPYLTDYEVFARKRFTLNDLPDSPAMIVGNALEFAIVEWIAKKRKLEIDTTPENLEFIHREHPLFISHLDAKALNWPTAIEAKYTGLYKEWGNSETDELPRKVWSQCQHQIMCTGFDYIIVGVLVDKYQELQRRVVKALLIPNMGERKSVLRFLVDDWEDKRFFDVLRNDDRIKLIIRYCEAWWKKYYIPNIAPPITTPPNPRIFSQIKSIEGNIVDIPRPLWDAYKITKLQTRQAAEVEKKARAEVMSAMGDAAAGRIPDSGKLYYPKETKPSPKLDNADELKLKHPDIYAQFVKEEPGQRWGEYKEEGDE